MAIKTSELNAKLFGKADKRRATTPQEAQAAAKEKTHIIELAVAGKERVEFELTTIPAGDIEAKTRVFSDNAREQSFLTEHALSDILVTLKERGQQYPAVGRRMDDGMIEVLDGSRRRMACILGQREFLVYVADNIGTDEAKFMSDVANAHKPLSLYERGKEMQAKLDSGEIEDQKALARIFQCSEALVSGALKAASLPLVLLQAYPNVSELGRPTIVRLYKRYSLLGDAQKQQLLDKVNASEKTVWQQSDATGVSRITKEVTDKLEAWIKELTPHSVDSHGKTDLVKGRASYVRKGNNLTLNLKKVDDEMMQTILNFVESKLN